MTSTLPTVRLVGPVDRQTACAVGNRAWRAGLLAAGVRLVDDESADVLIHHDYSQRFGDADLPSARRRIAVRPWDLGPYPPRWAEVVAEQYHELWVFTEWGRTCAIEGGIPAESVRVIPLGVDTTKLTVDGPRHALTESARTTFAFVGAAVYRKGIDLLVRAFVEAFDAGDDVRLVVKDHTRDVFYRGLSHIEEIEHAAAQPGAPDIVYLDDYMPEADLAALYRGADALVLPSRAEGWALPAVEAMACGTPPIVPAFGPFLAHCPPDAAVPVPTRRIRVPARGYFTTNTLGFEEYVDRVDFCETDPSHLAKAMREVADSSVETREGRARAARANAEQFTWARSVEAIVAALTGDR